MYNMYLQKIPNGLRLTLVVLVGLGCMCVIVVLLLVFIVGRLCARKKQLGNDIYISKGCIIILKKFRIKFIYSFEKYLSFLS